MKKTLGLFLSSAIALLSYADTLPANTTYEVCFTPKEDCTQVIVSAIHDAKSSIYLQAYSFTSSKIAHALVDAKTRGVDVRVILDQSNFDEKHFSQANYLKRYHIPIWDDHTVDIAHNKVMIIDGDTVETGSFNYTRAAQVDNAENVLILHSPALAKAYLENWRDRESVSSPI
ncbi:MAG: phospholipase D family protein [Gammaproteobacteria bacterium]|nr:phospholipase D family protein [Gammaproteobacteria bacterium]